MASSELEDWGKGYWTRIEALPELRFGQRADLFARRWLPKTGEFEEHLFADCTWGGALWSGLGQEWRPLFARQLVAPGQGYDAREKATEVHDESGHAVGATVLPDSPVGLPMKELFGKLDEILKRQQAQLGDPLTMAEFLSDGTPVRRPTTSPFPPDRRSPQSWVSPEGHIGWAMEALKAGQKIRRASWVAEGVWSKADTYLLHPDDIQAIDWEIAP